MSPITPRKIMNRLCEMAWMSRMLSSHLKPHGKPGELLEYFTSVEEKEILKNLRPQDLQNCSRPEYFCW